VSPESLEDNGDLVSSNNSILDLDKQDTKDQGQNIFQHSGSMDNPNLPKKWLHINYKK
jgi:hypothetical protein